MMAVGVAWTLVGRDLLANVGLLRKIGFYNLDHLC